MKIESVALIFQGACNQTHEGPGKGQGAEIDEKNKLVFRGGCTVLPLLYPLLHEQMASCHVAKLRLVTRFLLGRRLLRAPLTPNGGKEHQGP